jgi:hypothetical protein
MPVFRNDEPLFITFVMIKAVALRVVKDGELTHYIVLVIE